jgi:type II secretory pathway predicted ATPase ExeA/cell division septation protein DedD
VGAATSSSLTYEPFYGLREKPFSLSADPRFLFRSPAHGPAFDEILAGIRRREGLIVLTGEIGTGKTTLCRSVLQHLDRRTFAAFVADPFVSREDLLKTLLVDFGVVSIGDLTRGPLTGASRSDLSFVLYEFLDSLVSLPAFAVLVIDEAQNLSLPLLEEIRILSELERREKLLQVVLVGQPELRTNLKLPQMRQVDQRVSVRCELAALDAADVAGYVNHRLLVASHGEPGVEFTFAALEAVHQGSSGVPRLINRICDRALQHAYLSHSRQIDLPVIWDALEDLALDGSARVRPQARPETPPVPIAPATVISADSETSSKITLDRELDLGDAEVAADGDDTCSSGRSRERGRARSHWIPSWAAALVLAAAAATGALAWYGRAQAANGLTLILTPPPLPSPMQAATPTATLAPDVNPSLPQYPETQGVVRAPLQASHPMPIAASPTVGAAPVVPGPPGNYTILVASFKSAETAERVVEELTNAGFGARAVERDGGTARGRWMLVMVSGYTSAIDVQRDLQQIRELPGGYTDARIVERE